MNVPYETSGDWARSDVHATSNLLLSLPFVLVSWAINLVTLCWLSSEGIVPWFQSVEKDFCAAWVRRYIYSKQTRSPGRSPNRVLRRDSPDLLKWDKLKDESMVSPEDSGLACTGRPKRLSAWFTSPSVKSPPKEVASPFTWKQRSRSPPQSCLREVSNARHKGSRTVRVQSPQGEGGAVAQEALGVRLQTPRIASTHL